VVLERGHHLALEVPHGHLAVAEGEEELVLVQEDERRRGHELCPAHLHDLRSPRPACPSTKHTKADSCHLQDAQSRAKTLAKSLPTSLHMHCPPGEKQDKGSACTCRRTKGEHIASKQDLGSASPCGQSRPERAPRWCRKSTIRGIARFSFSCFTSSFSFNCSQSRSLVRCSMWVKDDSWTRPRCSGSAAGRSQGTCCG